MSDKLKISDFHIGFEYEELVTNPERYMPIYKKIWIKKTYGFNSPRLHKIERRIKCGLIRRPQLETKGE